MVAGESYDDGDVASSSGRGGDGRRATSGCSCLPLCFWKSRSRGRAAGPERRERRRRRFRLRLSWFSWPWLRKSRGGTSKENDAGGRNKKKAGKRRRRRRLLLLLLTASKQAKKALAPVSSAGSFLAQVSSFGGAKEQNRSKPRRTVDDDDGDAPSTSCAIEAAPGAIISPPCPSRPATGGAWAASSSRLHSPQPDRGGTDLWTAATTLGVIVFFGRVTAIIFLCSCLYSARQFGAGGGVARGDIASGGSSSLRLGDRVAVELWTEEYKKKVIMDGLLDRAAGKRPSSRFCQ